MAKTLEEMREELCTAFDLAISLSKDTDYSISYEESIAARSNAVTAAANAATAVALLDEKIADLDAAKTGVVKPAVQRLPSAQ